MKQCPDCKKSYADDMFFCLDDGNPLIRSAPEVDSNAPTEANIYVRQDNRTEVLPVPVTDVTDQRELSTPTLNSPRQYPISSSRTVAETPRRTTSGVAYIIIGALAATCIALVVALLFMSRSSFFGDQTSSAQPANVAPSTPVTNPTVLPSPVSNATATTSNQTIKTTPKALSPVGRWKGEWSTDSGTLFDFDLRLSGSADNNLDGQVRWTMRKTVRPDKMHKVGLSATEFVRGTFEADGSVRLNGYRKDDPDNVLVMLDEYKLKISPDSRSLSGSARNGGKWNGRVSLSRMTAGE